jgi:cytochrome c biogenesis protein
MRQSLGLVWRTLRSMRTALILLFLLALASVGGSLLPQVPNTPDRVARYLVDHPFWGDLFWRAGLFDVFGSWWFGLIVTLLFVSLVACLLSRTRALYRAVRQRPVQAAELDALPHHAVRVVRGSPDDVLGAASAVLRRRFYRVDVKGTALAAEKGSLREAGSLLFHWALVLLLAGVIVGKGTGYSGRATIVEGQTWVDAPANFDGTLRVGRWGSEHSGVAIELLEFRNDFRESGVPMDFVSRVELTGSTGSLATEVRVNAPARFEGVRIFQYGFGWAPVIRVERDGEPLFDGPVVMGQEPAPEGVSQLAMPWLGVVKLSSESPQVAVRLELWPDGRAFFGDGTTPMTSEFAPVMRYGVWEGELGDLSLGSLDTTRMRETGSGIAAGDWVVDLDGSCVVSGPRSETAQVSPSMCDRDASLTMGFTDLRRYSVLQVSKDSGVPVVLVAAILLLLGLMPALYTSRRKVWVRAEAAEGGTAVEVGGSALQRKAQFEIEFAALVDAIAGGTPDG